MNSVDAMLCRKCSTRVARECQLMQAVSQGTRPPHVSYPPSEFSGASFWVNGLMASWALTGFTGQLRYTRHKRVGASELNATPVENDRVSAARSATAKTTRNRIWKYMYKVIH